MDSIEKETAERLAHRERIAFVLAQTGGEVIDKRHYEIREAIRLAVLDAIDQTTLELEAPRMRDGELPDLFRALDAISSRIFMASY